VVGTCWGQQGRECPPSRGKTRLPLPLEASLDWRQAGALGNELCLPHDRSQDTCSPDMSTRLRLQPEHARTDGWMDGRMDG
jgi:hypothetical protein